MRPLTVAIIAVVAWQVGATANHGLVTESSYRRAWATR